MARPEYPPPPQCECRGECFAELAGVPVIGSRQRRRRLAIGIAIAIAVCLLAAPVIALLAGAR
jgi:hypothetical protein